MPLKKVLEHRGFPTAESVDMFVADATQLLECQECGAWVAAENDDPHHLVLEKHLDRRPKPSNRNRQMIIPTGRGF